MGSSSPYDSQSESNYSDEEDREYTGDMFVKTKPIKFASGAA